jgi:multiple sugar transport system permease protein
VLALLAIGIYPTVFAVLTSFRRYNIARRQDMLDGYPFVGFANYAKVLGDQTFWDSLLLTGRFFLTVVPIQIALGIVIAIMLHRPGWGLLRSVTRVSLVVPLATTYAVVGLIGRLIFNRDFGVANQMLGWIGISSWDWLGSQTGAFTAIVVMDVWQWTPFVALIVMGGYLSLPSDVYDAAEIDGAESAWSRFRLVTWPMLGPVTLFVVAISAIRSFQVFDTVQVLTKGGPSKSSEVLIYTMYTEGFEFFRSGYGAAVTVVFLGFVLLLTLLKSALGNREVHHA